MSELIKRIQYHVQQDAYRQQNLANDGTRFLAWYLRNVLLQAPGAGEPCKAATLSTLSTPSLGWRPWCAKVGIMRAHHRESGPLQWQASDSGDKNQVQTVLEFLAAGDSAEGVLEEYPALKREDVQACLDYASKLTPGE